MISDYDGVAKMGGTFMKGIVVGITILCAAMSASADCGSRAKQFEYRSTPPLLAHDANSALVVSVHADGCVFSRFPDHDVRKGSYTTWLDTAAYRQLVAEIEAAGVQRIDTKALNSELAEARSSRAKSGAEVFRVLDENIVEFGFGDAKSERPPLRWKSLRADMLTSPSNASLIGIASAQELFEELAQSAAEKGARQ